jgi:ABC-2 type transport system permease protein
MLQYIMNNIHKIRNKSFIQFFTIAGSALIIAYITSYFNLRLDLTEDKRYTLSETSHEVLGNMKNDLLIQVYLDGDMPIAFKRLRRSVKELLDEFRINSGRRVDYVFINPSEANNENERNKVYQGLLDKGLNPVNINSGDSEGGTTQKIIFPGMIVNYNGIEIPVNFLNNNTALSAEQNLLNSTEGLEYEMIQAISTICSDTIYKVAFIEGHNELPEIEVADITLGMARYFTVDRGAINGTPGILDPYSAIVIADPQNEFDEKDKFVIDQYIMNGGKVLWLAEEVKVNADSLDYGETVALYRPLNIEDQLFRYGARINPAVVQDMEDCLLMPLTVVTGTQQQIVPAPWYYYPLLNPANDNPITRNLNQVKGEFVNYIDTVGLDPSIRKKILLRTSLLSRTINPPAIIRLEEAANPVAESEFRKSYLPVAVLLEGKFQSVFKNRMISGITGLSNTSVVTESKQTKMIIIADGDIIRNEVAGTVNSQTIVPLGYDRYTSNTFGNKDFIINCLNYLVNDNGIMELRSREIKLRLLDKNKIKNERLKYQVINTVGPLLIILIAGLLYNYFRRKRYTN